MFIWYRQVGCLLCSFYWAVHCSLTQSSVFLLFLSSKGLSLKRIIACLPAWSLWLIARLLPASVLRYERDIRCWSVLCLVRCTVLCLLTVFSSLSPFFYCIIARIPGQASIQFFLVSTASLLVFVKKQQQHTKDIILCRFFMYTFYTLKYKKVNC